MSHIPSPPSPQGPPRPPRGLDHFGDDNVEDFTPQSQSGGYVATPAVESQGKGSKKGLIVAGAIGAVAVLGAGIALGVNSFLSPSGTHAYDILPADGAIVYAEVNLDPTAEQKTAWLSLSKKLDANPDGKSIRENTSALLGDFNKIDPWLGDRVAFTAYSDLGTDGIADSFNAYQIKDQDAAKAFGKSFEDPYVIIDDYFIISESAEGQVVLDALAAYDGKVLANNDVFLDDLQSVGENNVVHGWIDAAKSAELQQSMMQQEYDKLQQSISGSAPLEPADNMDVTGRIVLSAQLNSDGVEAQVLGRDFTVNGKAVVNYANLSSVSDEFKALPAASAALSISGLDQTLKALWGDEELAATLQEVEQVGTQLGLTFPEDITKIVGSVASASLDIVDNGENVNLYTHLRDADHATWSNLLTQSGLTAQEPGLKALDSGNGVAITLGTPSAEKIGDTPAILDTLPDLDNAGVAIYADIDSLRNAFTTTGSAPENADETLGRVGVTVSSDDNDWSVNVKWITQ